ncbi:MAG: DUF3846 domain-containing protein [Oscillospiraceae bacterium]
MNTLRILKIEPGKEPFVKEIPNTLKALQAEVGGYIEALYGSDGTVLVCNEEGRLLGLEACCYYRSVLIFGPAFLVGNGGEDFISLTEEQIAIAMREYAKCTR